MVMGEDDRCEGRPRARYDARDSNEIPYTGIREEEGNRFP